MKLSILFFMALSLTVAAQASVTVREVTFTCKNANETLVLTEKKMSSVRFVTVKRVDTVVRANSNPEVTPDKGAVLIYANAGESSLQSDMIFVKDQTDRQVLQIEDDKCTDNYYSKTAYKIDADVAIAGLSTISVKMNCIEELSIYEDETP